MRLNSDEQLKTIAGFVAELILAIENRTPPQRKETWPEWMARMHNIDIGQEIAEGRRRAREASAAKAIAAKK
jgi:hypothetical protein